MNNEVCRILTGGRKYDTTGIHSDTDYLIILDEDIEFKRIYDEVEQIDYLCYGRDFIEKLLSGKATHFNLPYVLLEMANQDVYPTKYDLFGNIDYVKDVYVKWLTKNNNAIIKNLKASKRIFYAFVLMYWVKNSEYRLNPLQQKVVNKVHQRQELSLQSINEFIEFYGLDGWYKKELISLVKLWRRKAKKKETEIEIHEKRLKIIREKREKECFTIINRGQLWYASLSSKQVDELQDWYREWLDVTETMKLPKKPDWLR